jgi:hypothetical protein
MMRWSRIWLHLNERWNRSEQKLLVQDERYVEHLVGLPKQRTQNFFVLHVGFGRVLLLKGTLKTGLVLKPGKKFGTSLHARDFRVRL